MQLTIRILGILGLILSIIPFQFNKHKHIVLCKMASCLAFSSQYFLLGPIAYTGAWMDLMSAFRNFLFYKFVEKKLPTLPIILGFSALVIYIGFTSWEGWVTLLAVIPKLLTSISYGLKNEKVLRIVTSPSCLFWIAYNCIVGNYEAAISDFLTFVSIMVAIFRYDIMPLKKKMAE
ncbi:MAG: YgjV family protein [Clostridia bacterium]|nr:YgjV family protein [Clostridia bacterium]